MDQENVNPPSEVKKIEYRSNYLLRPIIIWIVVLLLGMNAHLFRIPVTNSLIILSTGGLLGYTVHSFINTKRKSIVINILFILNCGWLLYFIYMIFLKEGWHLNERAFLLYLTIALIYFVVYRVIYKWKTKNKS